MAAVGACKAGGTVLRILASSVCVAHRAGKIIRDVMKKGELGIVEKGINDLQTEADRAAQRCIIASLHRQFPKVALFGEEDEYPSSLVKLHPVLLEQQKRDARELDPREQIDPDWVELSQSDDVLCVASRVPEDIKAAKDDEIVVWVDPLDGTSEYTQGLLDHVTVLIGIAVKGQAVGGVVYQPYYNYKAGDGAKLGRCIWGIIGVGCFGITPKKPPEGENIVTTTRSHSTKQVTEAVEACDPTEITRVGGAGHKVLLLLEGEAHAYVFASPGSKKWDTAAPEAVLHAAGGKLTDIHGNQMQYHHTVQRRNIGGVLAVANAEWHSWYLERIPESVKASFPVS